MHMLTHIYSCDAWYIPSIYNYVVVTHNASCIRVIAWGFPWIINPGILSVTTWCFSLVNVFVNMIFLDFTINNIT